MKKNFYEQIIIEFIINIYRQNKKMQNTKDTRV